MSSIEVVTHVAVRKNIAAVAAVAAYSALQWRWRPPKVQPVVVVAAAAKTWPIHSMRPVVNQRVMVSVVRILAAFVVPNVLIAPFGSSLMRNCSPCLDDTARPRQWRSVVDGQSQNCDGRSPHSVAAAAGGGDVVVGGGGDVMVPLWLFV